MKIQCDVCNQDEASVFCSADEAALCNTCDHRVHHANKLAGMHQRFSLLHPSPKQVPLCDICQEKRAFLFCQQDRAILCIDCDFSIHKANEHTQKHNRFLLTGVKLSATSALYSPSSSSSANSFINDNDTVPNLKSQNSINKPISPPIPSPKSINKTKTTAEAAANGDKADGTTSSISEYLEMLPGWHVEDFLDSNSTLTGFCKTNGEDVMPFWDSDLETNNLSSFSSENKGIWVPKAPSPLYPYQSNPSSSIAFGEPIGFKEATNIKSSRKWRDEEGCFAVPQIIPQSTESKRSRTFW